MASVRGAKGSLGRYGEPATLVLLSLMDGPKHGYGIMLDIAGHIGIEIGPGTLYTAISKLVKLGLIASLQSEARAKPYEITPAGREEIEKFLAIWSPIVKLGEARLT